MSLPLRAGMTLPAALAAPVDDERLGEREGRVRGELKPRAGAEGRGWEDRGARRNSGL